MIDDALSMYDHGELTREEVFAQFARALSPSNVGLIKCVVSERNWQEAFSPWLEAIRNNQQFMVAGRYLSPTAEAVLAAGLAYDASTAIDSAFESLHLALRDADAHERLPREAA